MTKSMMFKNTKTTLMKNQGGFVLVVTSTGF
jgi:hypothetical protein